MARHIDITQRLVRTVRVARRTHIELSGFKPGDRIDLSFSHTSRQITICPDCRQPR
ncbi:hypothetical protein BDI4_1880004 [Burkholderia diffusa]|nr:hypothetical protein BDI4_1880004 [Burkholderia diffusa]